MKSELDVRLGVREPYKVGVCRDMWTRPIVKPSSNRFGAEIENVDLSKPLSSDAISIIKSALSEFGVITFKNQDLSSDSLVKVAEYWSDPVENSFIPTSGGHKYVSEIIKRPEDKGILGGRWHSDHSYHETPALAAVLYCIKGPKKGGDTYFLNTTDAHSELPGHLLGTLKSSVARHQSGHVFGNAGRTGGNENFVGRVRNRHLAVDQAEHPVIIRHPSNGKPSVYVNPNFTIGIVGYSEEESRETLDNVYNCVLNNSRKHTVKWRPGSLAIWDNRMTWHKGSNDFPGQLRHMIRVAISGERLFPYHHNEHAQA